MFLSTNRLHLFFASLATTSSTVENKGSFNIKRSTLTYYANTHISVKTRYRSFSVKKKNGGERIIHSPQKTLKYTLRLLNIILQCCVEPHHRAMGFVPSKSIVDNAKLHIGKKYVYNIDLKDFFHGIDRDRVRLLFTQAPFNFKVKKKIKDKLGDNVYNNVRNKMKRDYPFFLARLITHPLEIDGEIKYVLPQGSPTSPTITNIVCMAMDRRLHGLAKRFNATYSRYADDITFSADYNFLTESKSSANDKEFQAHNFLDEMRRIIEVDQGFTINPSKTRMQKAQYRQEVTGLTVNEKVNVTRRYVKQLRTWLYQWEQYGYLKAENNFNKDYRIDKGHLKKRPSMQDVVDGKLEYLKMVKK
jgi:hypothetical protein